jgi:hypothetical protein
VPRLPGAASLPPLRLPGQPYGVYAAETQAERTAKLDQRRNLAAQEREGWRDPSHRCRFCCRGLRVGCAAAARRVPWAGAATHATCCGGRATQPPVAEVGAAPVLRCPLACVAKDPV